jgi:hypothetical protein
MAGESLDVTARTYHTENGVAHAEGETYAVTDRVLAETLRGIGFVSIEGWTDAPPPESLPATGATAGTPGTFTPAGCVIPATLAAMTGLAATPATAWTTGESVVLGDASEASWDGTAWIAGPAA